MGRVAGCKNLPFRPTERVRQPLRSTPNLIVSTQINKIVKQIALNWGVGHPGGGGVVTIRGRGGSYKPGGYHPKIFYKLIFNVFAI